MESAAIHSSEVHEVDSGIPMILFKGFFYLSVSPARRASPFSPSLSSIVFTPPSVPLIGGRNPKGREDVTALSAAFLPLRLSCKESSTSNQAFLLRRKDVTALLGARNRFALWLAGHQSPAPCFAGWDRRETTC